MDGLSHVMRSFATDPAQHVMSGAAETLFPEPAPPVQG